MLQQNFVPYNNIIEENNKKSNVPLILKYQVENSSICADFIKKWHLALLILCDKINRKW